MKKEYQEVQAEKNVAIGTMATALAAFGFIMVKAACDSATNSKANKAKINEAYVNSLKFEYSVLKGKWFPNPTDKQRMKEIEKKLGYN